MIAFIMIMYQQTAVAKQGTKNQCAVCYMLGQKKAKIYCAAPQCSKFRHGPHLKYDSFKIYQSSQFDQYR